MPNNVPKVGRRTRGIYLHGSVAVLTIVQQIYKPKMAKDWTYLGGRCKKGLHMNQIHQFGAPDVSCAPGELVE